MGGKFARVRWACASRGSCPGCGMQRPKSPQAEHWRGRRMCPFCFSEARTRQIPFALSDDAFYKEVCQHSLSRRVQQLLTDFYGQLEVPMSRRDGKRRRGKRIALSAGPAGDSIAE
eukprot:1828519-Alexandrium_andersonii.AAC.1